MNDKISNVLSCKLSWMYCELTGDLAAPPVKSTLFPCQICKLFIEMFNYINLSFITTEHTYKYFCRFLESLFDTNITEETEANLKRLSCQYIYKTLRNTHRVVILFCRICLSTHKNKKTV